MTAQLLTQQVRAHPWQLATTALLLVQFTVILLVFRDYGLTYDEPWMVEQGESGFAFYASGFKDRSIERTWEFIPYGVFYEVIAASAVRLVPQDPYETRHLLNALFGMLAVAGAALIGTRLSGPRAGFFAAILLLLTPRFFGHAFNNPKDIPFAAMYIWSLYGVLSLGLNLPRPTKRLIIFAGILIGLAIGIRIGGLLLLGWLGLLMLAWLVLQRTEEPHPVRRMAVLLASVTAVAGVTSLVFYPAILLDPLRRGWEVLKFVKRGSQGSFQVFFDGAFVQNNELPVRYVWTWIVHTLPEATMAGLLLAGAALGLVVYRRQSIPVTDKVLPWSILILAALTPFVMATLLGLMLYDGIRHFLFATSLLVIPAGAGVAWFLSGRRPVPLRLATLALFVAALTPTAYDIVRLHPYQTVWFNRITAGGLQKAGFLFETDYWGNSYKEGFAWVAEHLAEVGRRPSVMIGTHPDHATAYLPGDVFKFAGSYGHDPKLFEDPYSDPPDYYVSIIRWGFESVYPGAVIHRVERDGVPLLVVVKVDRQAALQRAKQQLAEK